MTRPLSVVDLFCGAGGLSEAAEIAAAELGRPIDLVCVNHWQVAIATHMRMHPAARHFCQDIATLRPRDAVPGGALDLLLAAPSCTHHSRARGGLPTEDQLRADPWHIVTWLTELRVKRLLVENVPEFLDWGPVNAATGRPVKSRKGEYFRQWCATLKGLGFKVQHRIINAADHGDATTRCRFILKARSDGRPIRWAAASHSRDGGDLLGGRHPWRPARDCIDWSLPGKSIFRRPVPLRPKTLQRIYAGITRHRWPEPFIVVLRNHMDSRSIDVPLPTIIGSHLGLVTRGQPFVLSQGAGGAARSTDQPVPTIVGRGMHALISPYYGSGSGETCKTVDAPLDTIATKARFGLVMPITHADGSNRARSITEPLPTITTASRGELALVDGCAGENHDILYRMLQPHELAAATSFNLRRDYQFAGNKTETIKQIGNAVPVRLGRAEIAALLEDAA